MGVDATDAEINAARYGMTVAQINNIVETAVGGKIVTKTVEGRERYAVRVRYLREYRDEIESLESLPVVTPRGETLPLGVLAKMTTTWGPAAISSEDARLVSHVAFSPSGNLGDLETVEKVEQALIAAQKRGELNLPSGYEIQAVGSFQNQIEANKRLSLSAEITTALEILVFSCSIHFHTISMPCHD